MNKDAHQKDLLIKHFAASGWYVQPETVVSYRFGVQGQKKNITDIDVLALRCSSNLRWESVLGDCKTLKNVSPVNRVLWVRGLMDFIGASNGIIVLQKGKPIELDHKLFGANIQVTLLDEQEFDTFDKALVFPRGSSAYPLNLRDLTTLRELPARYPALRSLTEYVYSLAWAEKERIMLIRKIIGEVLAVSKEIDPAKPEHLALVLDAASVFAIGLSECVGIVFNEYLHPKTSADLDDALKVIIWGGRENYDFISKLRTDLMLAKGFPTEELSLPSWEIFIQLARNLLDNPKLAFSVPQLLRMSSVETLQNRPFLGQYSTSDLLLLKFAMLTVSYLCRAAKLPPQVKDVLESKFVRKQSELAQMAMKIDNANSPVEGRSDGSSTVDEQTKESPDASSSGNNRETG